MTRDNSLVSDESKSQDASTKRIKLTGEMDASSAGKAHGSIDSAWQRIVRDCISPETTWKQLGSLEEGGAIEDHLWPIFFSSNLETSDYDDAAFAVATLIQRRCHISSSSYSGSRANVWDGPFGFVYHRPASADPDISNEQAFLHLIHHLFQFQADHMHDASIHVAFVIIAFLIAALQAMEPQSTSATKTVICPVFQQLTSIGIWQHMSPHIREYHLRSNAVFRQRWNKFIETDETNHNIPTKSLTGYLPSLARRFLTMMQTQERNRLAVDPTVFPFLHVTLQLFIDLLSIPSTRRYTKKFLLSIHFSVLCTCSDLYSHGQILLQSNNVADYRYDTSTVKSQDILLFAQLVQRLQDLETFGMDDISCAPFSTTQMQALYHERASILQKMIHQHYSQALPDLVYASVAIICEGNDTMHNSTAKTFLRKHLDTVVEWEEVLLDLAHRLRLLDKSEIDPSIRNDEDRTREFVTQVLLYHHTLQPSEAQRLQRLPLFPDETLLWNPHLVPPGHTSFLSRKTTTLALPKLGTQFLTFGDYLVRVYTLMRLESAYEIRSDLVDVIRRMKPTSSRHFSSENRMIHPQSNRNTNNTPYVNVPQLSEERIEQISRQKALTEFHGWARMGLELSTSSSFRIVQVSPPRLGENIPSQVIGELCWDLSRCSEGLRKEWDDLSDFDSLFLIAVDATAAVTIDLSPTVECDEDDPLIDDKNHLPDEEDVTFPRRYGILAVRGCTVLEIRDDVGNVVNDVARDQSDVDTDVKLICKSHLRFLRVELDAAQYAADISGRGSFLGPEVYSFLNVVVRRQAKENNFKAILETIRSLIEGSGSVHKSIPSWFRPVFLGYGDPSSVSYKSKHMMTYAQKTSGLRETNFTLDYRDTFLDESHLRESFPTCQVRIDDKDFLSGETSIRSNYRVQVFLSDNRASSVTASAYSRPANCKGNSIRFTPVQVEAIRSGLSSGISLIVGPPGTGKTDVAVQIISNLFHSFPSQRTVIVTHSNAALNDLFEKVMIRGDIDERYVIRLGSGERDIRISSLHDFTKAGRVKHSLFRRLELLEKVQYLSESLGISGSMERGPDGSTSYTCETAEYFRLNYIERLKSLFYSNVSSVDHCSSSQLLTFFPFRRYYGLDNPHGSITMNEARMKIESIDSIFNELAEYRPLELLRSQKQRSDYLITKQARIVAMTCTHAAIVRSHLVKIGFRYDNVVIEEAGQMLDIESLIPLLLQSTDIHEPNAPSRLKRICLIGDHHQLPPVVKNVSLTRFSRSDQSLFSRLIAQGVPTIQLNKQGRARPEIAKLYRWRYDDLGDLDFIFSDSHFKLANAGFAHTYQLIDCENQLGRGESSPTPFFYQNVGEAEYAVAIFQYMVMIGYPPEKITLLTTYNGQKELLLDILSQRCGDGTPLANIRPYTVSTVDQYQGQQNDYVILSLVRTKTVGYLRDIRRLIVATSRARLGLYVLCRKQLFSHRRDLKETMDLFEIFPNKLQLVVGEHYPTERTTNEIIDDRRTFVVDDVLQMGQIVYDMQNDWCDQIIS